METYQAFIGGRWVEPAGGQSFESFNPYTAKPWALIPRCGAADVARAVEAAKTAFERGEWPAMTPTRRGAVLRRLGDLILQHAERLATVETRDGGRLIAESRGQINYMPQWYHYYAGLADKMEGSVPAIDRPDMLAFTRHEPLGVIAAFTAWNAPIMMMTWKMAPALAAGNTIVIKPSEFASASTLEFMHLVEEAGVPPGVINVVTGFGEEVGEALVSHPDVAKVTFTGGEPTARKIAAAAARNLIPTVFELGGKSANIVFADADLDNAVKGVVAGIFAAGGQTCVAGSRALVARSIHDAFLDRLVAYAADVRLGDPMAAGTQMGPLGTLPQRAKVLDYIAVAQEEGAELALGGKAPDPARVGDGWFVEPTIFRGVHNRMRIAQEEVFGPILSVIPFDDEEEEALAIANDIPYGLAGGVWSANPGRALRAAQRLKAGTVWINTYRAISYLVPFGGMKRSGFGRENGQQAIAEFLQTKAYWMSYADHQPEPFVMR